jgi:ribonuclease Z
LTKLTLHFIGTGAGAPTHERGAPSLMLIREGERFVFDCGEGTQIAIRKFGLGFRGLKAVFVTHLHGDHVLGIPGLVMTLNLNSHQESLAVFGPKGIKNFLESVFDSTFFEPKFELRVVEIEPTTEPLEVYTGNRFSILTVKAEHTVPSVAYALVEHERPGEFMVERALELGVPKGPLWAKLQRGQSVQVNGKTIHPSQVLGPPRRGRKIVYSGDTRPCEQVLKMGYGADVFVHEATMPDDSMEEAVAGGHSTISEAIRVLKLSGCKVGVLTNFGQKVRKEDLKIVEEFGFLAAFDGLSLDVPLP